LTTECFKTEEIGSMMNCWQVLKEETQSLSEKRQTFCTELESLINTVTNNIKEDKKNRASLGSRGDKIVLDLSRTEDTMKKARAKYVEARKRQDRAQESVQKSKVSGSSLAKFQKAAEKDEKKADKADNEYRISVNNLKVGQDKFYETDMPNLLKEFEQFEEKRLNMSRDYLNLFVEKQAIVGPHWIESNDRILAKVREINSRSDLELYIERNRPESNQPPPRAQYISYDGSVVQDANPTSGVPIAPSKKPMTIEALIPKLPMTKKKKDGGPSPPPEKPTIPHYPNPPAHPPAGQNDISEEDRPHNPHHHGSSTIFNPPKQLIAQYSYDATEANEISFTEGEIIFLLEKDDSGWWRGRNAKEQEGVFPSNFVGDEGNSGLIEINKNFKVLYDYGAEDETELTIKEGEILHVISETDGWYFGTNAQGKEGNFPSNYVEKIDKDHKE